MRRILYTKELLEGIVRNVHTYSDVCRALGLYPNSGNIKTLHHKFIIFKIDTSHFYKSKELSIFRINRPLNEILVENSNYLNTDCLRRKELFQTCMLTQPRKERRACVPGLRL